MSEIPKAYDPQANEKTIYQRWLDSGYFNPDKLPGKRTESFSISMPPPNATGILHIGHSVMLAIEDAMIRFERMRGKKALWLPGADHAAIATQNVVEQELKEKGSTKHDLGREAFLARVEDFVTSKRGRIKEQVERMGASCDWSRERFTLDAGLSKAVFAAFQTLYDDGLIYRGTKVVNWCPRCQSTLADDEIEYKEKPATLSTFRYDANFPLPISTTRPETKFGDTAVAVHPSDERYKQFIGKEFSVMFAGVKRTIRVVTDPAVEKDFGTGALGVTPAHSAIDERIAQREKLPSIVVIDQNGKMTAEAGEYAGLSVKEARKKLVERLRNDGLVEHEEPIQHNLSLCYRCGTPIEPMPLLQWFVAVEKQTGRLGGKSLKDRALQVVRQKEIRFVPERFGRVYEQWMENLHDWCISRQIWYGHRIPVWYKEHDVRVSQDAPGSGWTQDPDTLDTWFSSSLWTFSTLGWPEKTKDLATFHPTSVMETGYDIIFFWVARMILMSTYLRNEIPFQAVYLHGLVRDSKGRKMSKSLGNGIDPLEMADKYGADAVRLALVIGTTPGNDQKLDEQKIKGYRNYVNKVWNIGRFLAMQSEGKTSVDNHSISSLADHWIAHRMHQVIEDVTRRIERFEFSMAGELVYDFGWHEFADWYLEFVKDEGNITFARSVSQDLLKLLHPFMPFITQTLWSLLEFDGELLIAPWPVSDMYPEDARADRDFKKLQGHITRLRARVDSPDKNPRIQTVIDVPAIDDSLVNNHKQTVERLARVHFVAS